ncbi:MAG: glycosyltransferase [Firmicutes bacterium]|nr:glycosyltransferase [Bacillota bacterium]
MEQKNDNILMTLMGLEIGGAETHVVELAKELQKQGLNMILASNGGVYEKELSECGIKHYKVPLHNKQPHNVIKSYKSIKRVIREEKIDLVHAHARIPAFICGLLHEKMKFPFVTTAHWVFNTGWGLKYITNWGQKTLAVSEDIKTYLMQNYQVREEDIKVTINGIDTEKFSPHVDFSDIKEDFKLKDSGYRIVTISRLDSDRSDIAFQLVEIVPELVKEKADLEVVIVGGGNVFERLNEKVNEMNQKLGRRVIVMTGPRTDINKFVASADLFVGVSRAALEAMAAAKPVILAGNEGYIGIFDEQKLPTAINSNFTCRGSQQSGRELLKRDVLHVFNQMDQDEKKRVGDLGRQTIEERYSVKKMARDNIEVYRQLLFESKNM